MPTQRARIVRFLSASGADTERVTRTNAASGRRRRAGAAASLTGAGWRPPVLPPPPTPLPSEALLHHAAEVRDLLDELDALTDSENAWGLRILRRNVELALRSPRTLETAENQMDFVEELAEAVWDGSDPGFRYAVRAADTPAGTRAREARRQEVVERFDRLAGLLCQAVERWRAREAAAAGETPSPTSRNPQDDNSF
jgi:hypothetical protein